MLQRLPRHFQRQTLLGIHQLRFAGGHPEELGVEAVEVLEEGAPPGGLGQHRGVARIAVQIGRPPLRRDLPNRTATG